MKGFLLLLGALLLSGSQPARGTDVSLNLFYDNLSGGTWYEVADYGYVWQPEVATDASWRPYTDGYWAYTDQGWTWVSYEDFGWATYHYGRWMRLADYGWAWVPGTEWAPAWVSWRAGGDYVGWAPLPPDVGDDVVNESRPLSGEVDVEFGIGPVYYNFVDIRFIGEPVLRDRIVDYNQNVIIIRNTVNVTNVTYKNSTVYNYGPDFATVSRYSVRPIQRLKLERQTGDPLQAVKNGNVTRVQGNALVVAAPQKLQKAANAQIAPKQVKGKIEQPKVEKGWANIDPNEKTQLEQKFKTENPKDIPKPNIQPRRETVNQPALTSSPGVRQGKGNRRVEPAPTESASENRSANAEEENVKRNERNKRGGNATRFGTVGAEATEDPGDEVKSKSENPNQPQVRENERRTNRNEEQQRAQPVQEREVQQNHHEMQNAPAANARDVGAEPVGSPQHRERSQSNLQQESQRRSDQSADQRRGKGKKNDQQATPPPE